MRLLSYGIVTVNVKFVGDCRLLFQVGFLKNGSYYFPVVKTYQDDWVLISVTEGSAIFLKVFVLLHFGFSFI